ncbi:MAG: hypothetical protein ABSH50_27655 [Bryobacteraceae bacterium]|jgi:hypothetical protein
MKLETAKEFNERYDREKKECVARLETIYHPLGPLEKMLVGWLAHSEWMLKNIQTMMAYCQARNVPEPHGQQVLDQLARSHQWHRRSLKRTEKQLRGYQKARLRADKLLPVYKPVEYLYVQ